MGEKMKGVQRESAELMDDQMVDVSFYALPFRSPLLIFKYYNFHDQDYFT